MTMHAINERFSRRDLLKHSIFGGASLVLGSSTVTRILVGQTRSSAGQPIVKTTAGKVRGYVAQGINIFKGIPYGASTEGENRFMPPKVADQWAGVRDVLQYGPMAMQTPITDKTYLEVLSGIYPVLPYPMSEDCLLLNVWSPELGTENKRPVMVWLHPGGFGTGAGNSDWSDGANLARTQDVIVVSINHRLGVFGFLALAEVGGPRYADSGNVGMLDIVQALSWVHENIAEFGGDPNNVTVFGESGGSDKVAILTAMPAAEGLFHKAIIQDDSMVKASPEEDGFVIARHILRTLGIQKSNIDKLNQVSARTILDAATRVPYFMPVIAPSLPRHPFDPDASPYAANVPIIFGSNKDTGIYMTSGISDHPLNPKSNAELQRDVVRSLWGYGVENRSDARKLIELYRQNHAGDNLLDTLRGVTANVLLDGIALEAERKLAQKRAAVFRYVFAWEAPGFGGKYGASHTFELPFVFNNVSGASQLWGTSLDSVSVSLAENMSRAFASFARSGDPSHPGIGRWDRYSEASRETMVFDRHTYQTNDPNRADRLAFAKARSWRENHDSTLLSPTT